MARKRVYQGGGGANSHPPQTGCVPPSQRSRNLQCQRIFQVNAPINCVCLHPNQVRGLPGAGHPGAMEGRVLPGLTSLVPPQAELIVGDQSGAIHIWDLKTDHNEQLIPEPEVSITSAHIDPDASYMAAVNSTVSPGEGVQPGDQLFRTLFPAGGLMPHVSLWPLPVSPASPFWALALTQPPEPEPWGVTPDAASCCRLWPTQQSGPLHLQSLSSCPLPFLLLVPVSLVSPDSGCSLSDFFPCDISLSQCRASFSRRTLTASFL